MLASSTFALAGCASRANVIRVDSRTDARAGGACATLEEAVELARALAGRAERVVIELAPGVHTLRRGVRIDSSFPPLTLRAEDPLNPPTLSGAHRIEQPAWRPVDGVFAEQLDPAVRASVWTLDLPMDELARFAGGLSGPVHSGHAVEVRAARSEVRIGSRAFAPARWPDSGFATIAEVLDPGSVPRQSEDDIPLAQRVSEPPRGGVFVPAERERAQRWTGARDAWALGYWNWDWSDELLPIAAVNGESGAVQLGMPHRYGLAQRGRFAVLNVAIELDAAGEYYLERENGRLHAVLSEGERRLPLTITLLAPALLTFDGAQDVIVQDVVLASSRGSGLVARGVRALRVERCRFEDLGARGVDIDGLDCAVSATSFERIGGTGVLLSGGDRATLSPGGNSVRDCAFRQCGQLQRTYNPAIELRGVGNSAEHNDISELPHIALVFSGNEHLIAGNHIHDVVQETGDAGAVYCGRDWTAQGTRIEGNLVHSIAGSDARYQNAFYLDDMASGITLRDNLFVRCNWGLLIGGGRDVAVLDNAFVACGKALSYDARGVGWMASHLADASTSTLLRRFAAMPVDAEPWRSRYPRLRGYLTEHFGRPLGGRVEGNLLVNTPLGRIEDRECVAESGTLDESVAESALAEHCRALIEAACAGPLVLGNTHLGPVGPRCPVGPVNALR